MLAPASMTRLLDAATGPLLPLLGVAPTTTTGTKQREDLSLTFIKSYDKQQAKTAYLLSKTQAGLPSLVLPPQLGFTPASSSPGLLAQYLDRPEVINALLKVRI